MFRLEMFGGLVLIDGGGSSVTLQRRRLALLALLATAGERGMSRDRIVSYLWPDAAAERARHNLEQLLYLLRRQLHEEFFEGTDPLRLNQRVTTSDVGVFEQALAGADPNAAGSVYHGPFLDGFYLADAGEFERWAEGERVRLAGLYAGVLERLADRAAERGDLGDAVGFRRKLVALDTFSSRSVLGLLRSLADAGDRPEALRLAATYEALIREELDISLEPELEAFVADLRAARVPASRQVPAPSMQPGPQVDTGSDMVQSVPASQLEAFHANATDNGSTRRRTAVLSAVLVVAMLTLAIGTTWRARGPLSSAAIDPERILISPFRVTGGDASLNHLREMVSVRLAARFTGEGGPAAIDMRAALHAVPAGPAGNEIAEDGLRAVARELGAGELLIGEVVGAAAGEIELSGRIVSSTDIRSAGLRASVIGPLDSVTSLVGRLAGQLLALRAREQPQRIASLSVRPPAALRDFLQGRIEHRRGNSVAARELFARALEHDTTFAYAALELSLATANVFRWTTITTDTVVRPHGVSLGGDIRSRSDEDLWNRAMELAWRGRDQLAGADQALLLALRVNYPLESFAHESLAGWERALRAAPDRAEAHYWYGYVLLHQGFALGLADSRTRAASSFAHAFALDSTYLSPLTSLIEIAAHERDGQALRRLRAIYLARDSVGDRADYVRWIVAAATGDEAELRRIRSRLASLDVGTLSLIQRMSQAIAAGLADGELADSAILARTHERQQRQVALYRAVFLLLNRGRPKEALRLMQLKREVDPNAQLGQGFAVRYALMWDGDSAAGDDAARALAPDSRRAARISVTLWRLWHGDTTAAMATIAPLQRDDDALGHLLDAMFAGIVHRADAAAALARLDSLALRGCCSQPHFINLVAARLHERAGNQHAALAAIRRGRWFHPSEYLSTYLREEGRLAVLTGDTAGAIAAYRHYLELRSDPEPALKPAVDRVRAELVRLESVPARRAWWRRLRG